MNTLTQPPAAGQAAHTPTPYERRGQMVYTEDNGNVGTSRLIAECHKVEDAAFIVRACNSYDALIDLLKNILSEDERSGGFLLSEKHEAQIRDMLARDKE